MRIGGAAVFVDTGAYAALILSADANHDRAVGISRSLARTGTSLFTTNFVLAETYALVLARAGRHVAIELLDRLERSGDLIVRVTEADEERARQLVRRFRDKSFSLVDTLSFAVMDRLAIPAAFTFDRHFAQYGPTLPAPE